MRILAIQWTADQQKAIDGRKGTMLVSAAAGSGKTAVLVERVIRRICDEENPCGVENLLIVTFTNAAVADMREKLAKALTEEYEVTFEAALVDIDAFIEKLEKAHCIDL